MEFTRIIVVFVLGFVAAGPALAQSTADGGPDPSAIRVRIGPVLLKPALELTNLGVDTNVFNQAADQQPKSDFTFTVTPKTDLWMRMGRSWLTASANEHLVWYQEYASERSANSDYSLSWKLPLNRLVLTTAGRYANTRDRPGFEIDARSQRQEYGFSGRAELRTFGATYFGISGSRQRVDFDKDAVFLDKHLNFELNRDTTVAGVSLRNQVTPLTSVMLEVSRSEDRFVYSSLRDSDSTAAAVSVSFDPFALIKGNATVGYRSFRPLAPGLEAFEGATVAVDLSYTLAGMTRVAVQAGRDIQYSYEVNQPYYLQTGGSISIAQQLFGPVDVGGRYGAQTLAYRDRLTTPLPLQSRTDDVRTYGGSAGYRVGRDLRISFNVDRVRRTSEVARRQYDALRYGTAVTYGF